MNIAVIGAGVNGVCSAIKFAEAGHSVSVFDKSKAFSETSSKSSRMFHGGIRYLEQGHFKLVREALVERKEWLAFALLLNLLKLAIRLTFSIKAKLFLKLVRNLRACFMVGYVI